MLKYSISIKKLFIGSIVKNTFEYNEYSLK